jgi:subtilisin family serine protease
MRYHDCHRMSSRRKTNKIQRQQNCHGNRTLRLEPLEERTLLSAADAWSEDLIAPLWFAEVEWNEQGIADPSSQAETSRWIVQLETGSESGVETVADAAELLFQPDAPICVLYGLGRPGQVVITTTMDDPAVYGALVHNPLVASFSKDVRVAATITPNDPSYEQGLLIGLENSGESGGVTDADIDAAEAWSVTTGDSSVVVAVVDSGVDYTHPDLAANLWTNPGEIAGNGIDDDGNGFIDDVHGYDFTGFDEGLADADPMDEFRHGTHVAGIIGATGNNGVGVTGVTWDTSIMALKFLDADNTGNRSDAIRAIRYATMMCTDYDVNVHVINGSWGATGGYDAELYQAIQESGDAGILFVAAAGNGNALGYGVDNDAQAFYPAGYDLSNVISVAASDSYDDLAQFSNYGATSVDIAAPGVSILSTEPEATYHMRSGTSMAAPFVSGTAALIWSRVPYATVARSARPSSPPPIH